MLVSARPGPGPGVEGDPRFNLDGTALSLDATLGRAASVPDWLAAGVTLVFLLLEGVYCDVWDGVDGPWGFGFNLNLSFPLAAGATTISSPSTSSPSSLAYPSPGSSSLPLPPVPLPLARSFLLPDGRDLAKGVEGPALEVAEWPASESLSLSVGRGGSDIWVGCLGADDGVCGL
jgi:hypothetical protein